MRIAGPTFIVPDSRAYEQVVTEGEPHAAYEPFFPS
jgi:hypothetical protein